MIRVEANASSWMEGRRLISITLTQEEATLDIRVENSAEDRAIRRSEDRFLSAKEHGGGGYGLSSVAAIAARYDGETRFSFEDASGTFSSRVLMIASGERK